MLDARYPTLLDITRSLDPDGSVAAVAEILTETNEMLLDVPFMEGNLTTGHRTTIRTGLPEPTFRMFYQAVQPTKSTRVQVTDSTAMMEDYAEIDAAEADLNGNTTAFRMSEDYAHIEGMSQKAQQSFIYGNASLNPEQFNGLAPRFNSLAADNAENIVNGGGSGTDNASIWLACWGPDTLFGIYPKGSQAGLQMNDKGQLTKQNADGNGGMYEIYLTHYRWDLGLVVKDWRYIVRIANIDRSNLTPDAATGANLPNLMFEAAERLPMIKGNCAFYMDRKIKTKLSQQIAAGVNASTLTTEQVGGVRVTSFDGIPIRRTDKLAVNEATVV